MFAVNVLGSMIVHSNAGAAYGMDPGFIKVLSWGDRCGPDSLWGDLLPPLGYFLLLFTYINLISHPPPTLILSFQSVS